MSASILLRSIRRRSILESTDFEEFCRAAFPDPQSGGLDLQVSVYEIADDHVCRIHCELLASGYDRPEFKGTSVDLRSIEQGEVVPTPGEASFAFAVEVHREIRMGSEAEVRSLAQALFDQRRARERAPEPAKMHQYVKDRIADEDVEWKKLCAAKPKWKKWADGTPPANDTAARTPASR